MTKMKMMTSFPVLSEPMKKTMKMTKKVRSYWRPPVWMDWLQSDSTRGRIYTRSARNSMGKGVLTARKRQSYERR